MGTREAAPNVDFSTIQLDQDVEDQVREAAVVSMGTEISFEDMTNIVELCDQARLQACKLAQPPACCTNACMHAAICLQARKYKQLPAEPHSDAAAAACGFEGEQHQ